ncbi:MAG: hypothetical protein ACI8R4_000314 [Paracoccaceae bacterium]|jgi:hypothetical protein
MKPDWTPLDTELARWANADLTLPLWWRDDDAVAQTPALDQLTALSDACGIPVHLAVIPAMADATLATHLRQHPNLIPMVHGWAHHSHAPEGQKKAEFGAHRSVTVMQDDAARGLDLLTTLFGDTLRPIFVPPWNRIAPEMLPILPALGFTALSTFTPRAAPQAAPGLAQINCHLDPISWHAGRSLADPDGLIRQIAGQLADRRTGSADNAEPYGFLTHHLVHDSAIWDFTQALLTRLAAGPVHIWAAPATPQKDTPT